MKRGLGMDYRNQPPLVYVVIVNYCNYDVTLNCIESVCKSDYPNYRVVIVDNGSPSKNVSFVNTISEKCEYIRSEENRGFSAGSNIGIQHAMNNDAEYVMLLNNDTIISSKMISILVDNANSETITVPKIYYKKSDDIIWYAGGEIDYHKADSIHIGINSRNVGFDEKKKCSFFSGCCALIPSNIIRIVGPLPEEYFLYYEDFDYSIAVKKRGYSIVYCPEAVMWHDVGKSTGPESVISIYYQTRNRLYVSKKAGFSVMARLYVYIWAIALGIRGLVKVSNDYIRFKAIADFWKGLFGKTLTPPY